MSLLDEIKVDEVYRDRYARESTLTNGNVSIQCPCHGVGVRSKKDLDTFLDLRLSQPTERLGFCLVSLADIDDTLISIKKELEEEKHKLAPTARGQQLTMLQQRTFFAIEPSTRKTYFYDKDSAKKILSSLETPNFIKDMITRIKKKLTYYENGKDQEFQDWKKEYYIEKWLELNSNPQQLNQLVNENFESQNRGMANIQIPPTPHLISQSLFYVATKIIETATRKAKTNTSIYFDLPFSILKDYDFRTKVIEYCEKSPNKIIILRIQDLDNLLDPDKEDERQAFSDIQDSMCELRRKNKFTVLLEGGKLTFPSLVRGFDVVTNNISGRNKKGGGPPRKKQPNELTGYSQYYIKDKQIFYQFPKMITFSKNQMELTDGEHGLKCPLPCCKDIKFVEDLTRDIWNYYVVRPHYCLTMNEIVKEISKLINDDKIQDAKNILLLSELCVLKHLIPDV